METKWCVVINAGCGHKSTLKAKKPLRDALDIFKRTMTENGDIVESAVVSMSHLESCGSLNAGAGSKLNENGDQQLDCCLMNGKDGISSCVYSCPSVVATPSLLCLKMMRDYQRSSRDERGFVKPLVVSGTGCVRLAIKYGMLDGVDPSLHTQEDDKDNEECCDTVGIIATDGFHCVAISSTGGYSGKSEGRISATTLPGVGMDITTHSASKLCYVTTGTSELLLTGAGANLLRSLRSGELPTDVPVDIGVVCVEVDEHDMRLKLSTGAPGLVVGYRTSNTVGDSPVRIYNTTGEVASAMRILMNNK